MDTLPVAAANPKQFKWLSRHCLRSADSALLLPALYLFHDGQSLRAEWRTDTPGSMPNMPGEFVSEGADGLDSPATQESFAQFIGAVLDRVTDLEDDRVSELRAQWRAIQGADSEEQHFCTLAGRMGLDPYDRSEMTDELSRFLEETIDFPESALVSDLTELARPDSVQTQWEWVTRMSRELHLGPTSSVYSFDLSKLELSPHQFGYRLARRVREAAKLDAAVPIASAEDVARSIMGAEFQIQDRNHVPGDGIRAIVGQAPGGAVVSAGPRPSIETSQRFLTARSVYHALVTIHESQRLVTDAYSWDQKASRAFAAELLAPQKALASRVKSLPADRYTIEELSREFKVSTMVIEKQLENAGVSLALE
ncbi:MAG: ImmA/IrrE family metallo-endopeptidase [Isosphaeraceae bacterium]